MINILAIDQSLADSGFAIYSNFKEEYDHLPNKNTKMSDAERIYANELVFEGFIRDYNINHVVLEGYAYGAKNGAQLSGEVGGSIKRLCLVKNLPCIIITPGIHKKFTTGSGSTKKNLMLKLVYQKYGIDLTNDNIADAVSLLKTYQGFLQYTGIHDFGFNLNKKQIEAVKALAKYVKVTKESV